MKLSKRMIELRKTIADNIDRIDRNVIQSSLRIKIDNQDHIYILVPTVPVSKSYNIYEMQDFIIDYLQEYKDSTDEGKDDIAYKIISATSYLDCTDIIEIYTYIYVLDMYKKSFSKEFMGRCQKYKKEFLYTRDRVTKPLLIGNLQEIINCIRTKDYHKIQSFIPEFNEALSLKLNG